MTAQAIILGAVAVLALGGAVVMGIGLTEEESSVVAPPDARASDASASGAAPDNATAPAPERASLPADAAPQPATARPEPTEQARAIPSETPTAPGDGPPSPTLGLVRVDAAGGALVAGEGAPGTEMVLRIDGLEIARARADAQGGFVALFDLPSSAKARLLTLESVGPDGLVTAALDSIVVAPVYPSPPAVEGPFVPSSRPAEATAEEPAPTIADAPPTTTADAPTVAAQSTEDGDVATVAPQVAAVAPDAAPDALAPVPQAEAETDAPALSDPPRATATAPAPEPPQSVAVDAAPRAPRLFRAGPSGLTIESGSSGARPAAAQSLGIDVISYDSEGGVSLAGRGAGDQELRIFLDDQPVRRLRTGDDGAWVSPLPEIDEGTYTLRVETVAADGTVTASIETPFRRTAPEIAAQARRDGAEAITVQTGFTLWALSEGYFGDGQSYVQLFEANRDRIDDPDLIFPGQIFRLPRSD